MTVQEIYGLIDRFAPFETQAEFDNSGFLIGRRNQEVSGILFALDLTQPVIDEAVLHKVSLIITHHPLMFTPLRVLTDDDYEGRLIRRLVQEDISFIAAHTNLDQAPGGINDVLASCCGLSEVSGEQFFRCGILKEPVSAMDFAGLLSERLHTVVRLMGNPCKLIRKAGLCSGGGSEEWTMAVQSCCDAFISGEIKHHHALAMADQGLAAFECGHFATEEPGIRALAAALQKEFNQLECNMRIYVSETSAYAFPRQP